MAIRRCSLLTKVLIFLQHFEFFKHFVWHSHDHDPLPNLKLLDECVELESDVVPLVDETWPLKNQLPSRNILSLIDQGKLGIIIDVGSMNNISEKLNEQTVDQPVVDPKSADGVTYKITGIDAIFCDKLQMEKEHMASEKAMLESELKGAIDAL
ncbi:hypothetical protein L2E82_47248 [Cichorium intybus]|uniref:Uncharacterized protein n=1 Tax=Cichorium intybus TaxID=13427 RepID=A0ACB8YU75_CICIN|nr:hypothetical protein L2E82_47248 [Cichorium intybus]